MNNKHLFLLCMALFFTQVGWGVTHRYHSDADVYHFGYVTGSGGFSNIQADIPGAIGKGNWTGLVGLGYEFRNHGFWMTVGGQASFHRSMLTLPLMHENRPGQATNGQAAIFHYDITESDELKWTFLDIPVLLGYYHAGFYVGAGAKVSFPLSPTVKASGNYELSATHEDKSVTYHDIPEQGYTTYPYGRDMSVNLKPFVSLCGEIGYDLLAQLQNRSSYCYMLKLGFYFEYGLSTMARTQATNTRLEFASMDATKPTINPYMSSAITNSTHIVPYYLGLKLSFLFGGNKYGAATQHKGCMCYQK